MNSLGLDTHEQKLLVRKIFTLIEKDPLLEYFKLRIERADGEVVLSAAGQRAGKDIVASARGRDFPAVVAELRERIVERLPKRPEDARWVEETSAWPSPFA